MFRTELDRSRRLLKITVAGHSTPEEARSCLESLRSLLTDIQPGFKLFADLGDLLSMPTTSAHSIAPDPQSVWSAILISGSSKRRFVPVAAPVPSTTSLHSTQKSKRSDWFTAAINCSRLDRVRPRLRHEIMFLKMNRKTSQDNGHGVPQNR